MKRDYILSGHLRTLSILICILIIYASVLFGQSQSYKSEILTANGKVSDNPKLKISDDRKDWLPIPVPKFYSSNQTKSAANPQTFIEYDLVTKTFGNSNSDRVQNAASASQMTRSSAEFQGNFQNAPSIETIFSPDGRVKISPTGDFPWRTICKLYITFPDGNHFVGSGALIGRDDGIGFHCLTAAHCVYRSEYGGMATTIEIIPALDNDYTPFYSAWAVKIRVPQEWEANSSPEQDYACITLDRQLGNFTGWMGRFTTPDLSWYQRVFHCAGYPVDLDYGLCLYYDSDSARSADENFLWYKMDAGDGQDGMPIWVMEANTRRIVAIHIGGDDSSGSNRGIRFNAEKFDLIKQWIHSDPAPTDLPDLVDDGPKWSDFKPLKVVRGFSQFEIWNDVRNIGTYRSGVLSISYYASLDAEIQPNSDFLLGTLQILSIPPFSWRNAGWSGIFPEAIPAGEYYICWSIDPDNQILEFNESNNTAFIASKKLVVRDPYIEITTPNGGEVFAIGEENTCQWFTAGGSGLVTLDVTFDNGASWQNLATNLPDSEHYQWNIPASQPPAFSCLLRITDTFKNLTDTSNAVFIVETRPTVPGTPQDEGVFSNKAELAFSWTESNDPETGIFGYQVQIGTTPGGNDLIDTVVVNQLALKATGAHGQTVYARVRAQNGVGLVSHWSTASDGILIDLTPPTIPSQPVDAGEYSASDSILFQWPAAIDAESGIAAYHLQVGSAIDSADLFDDWVGEELKFAVKGKQAQTVYARISAKNGAGWISDWSDWSDGITIDMTPPAAPGKPYSEGQTINYFDIPFFWDPATDDISEIADYHLRVIDLNADSQVVFDDWVGNASDAMVAGNDGQALLASVQARNKAGLIGPWSTAELPVSIQSTPALLTLIEGSKAFEGERWDNAIDNDIEDWDGTVTAFANARPYPYAIFGFVGGGIGRIEKVKLLTDTKVGFKKRWVTDFQVLYSITGIQEQDFMPLVSGQKLTGDWEEFTFPQQTVKFIKLIIDQPKAAATEYCQLGEFQVFGRAEFVKTKKADLAITYGTPTDPAETWPNAIDGDIEGWDGTVTAMTIDPSAYVIFSFADQSIKNISKIRLLTDTGVRFSFRWLKEFQIEVSTTGIQKSDFSTVFSATKIVGDWESFYFDPVPAKYVKLVLNHPSPDESDYCQIGEVEIYTQTDSVPGFARLDKMTIHQSEPTSVVELPHSYQVEQNYPNPFNPETIIRFQLPKESRVVLTVYNMMGQEITTLVNEMLPAGQHSVTWRARDNQGNKVPTGMYLYEFRAGEFRVTKKMILLE